MFPVIPEIGGLRVFDQHYLSPETEVFPLDLPDHVPFVLICGWRRVFIKPENTHTWFLP